MLRLGEKGVIPQRDNETYVIAPHIPCGLLNPELLRRLADVAEKYNVTLVKITGATRIAMVGLKEEDIDRVWEDLKLDKGAAVGLCVRSIRTCPGNVYCKLGRAGRGRSRLETGKRSTTPRNCPANSKWPCRAAT